MKYPMEILLAGRSGPDLETLKPLLESNTGVKVTVRVISNGHADPLYGIESLPDVLVYTVSDLWEDELAALGARPPGQRPPTLVIGPANNFNLFRVAMQAGARDFFTLPLSQDDLESALERISRDLLAANSRRTADLTVVINAKGGSGASIVATNLAYIDALNTKHRTLLVDLDLQFGAVPVYLNLTPNNGLLKAFHDVERLDGLALDGLVLKHHGGLHVLATSPQELVMPQEVPESRVAAVFELLGHTYDRLYVDVPRQIDPLSSLVLQHADRVLVTMEASLTHVRDAKRLVTILQHLLGVPHDRIKAVINRYDKQGSLSKSDISDTLGIEDIVTLPSDFRRINESVNIGSPLYEVARSAPITKALIALSESLRPGDISRRPPKRGRGLLSWMRP